MDKHPVLDEVSTGIARDDVSDLHAIDAISEALRRSQGPGMTDAILFAHVHRLASFVSAVLLKDMPQFTDRQGLERHRSFLALIREMNTTLNDLLARRVRGESAHRHLAAFVESWRVRFLALAG